MLANVNMGCAQGGGVPAACRFSLLALSTAVALGLSQVQAADCPKVVEPNIPVSEQPAVNIDKHKKQLLAYKNSKTYDNDIAAVMEGATRYVKERAAENRKLPA